MKEEEEKGEGRDQSRRVNLGGIVSLSTVDWTGVAATVVFLRGCPLKCPHCQNWHLRSGESFEDLAVVEEKIRSASPFVSCVVLSGGEPLAQPRAAQKIAGLAKELGLKVGIETCGFYPNVLRDLVEAELVDHVFLDVKAPLSDPEYARATGREAVAPRVKECLEICLALEVPLEVRTTVFPEMPSLEEVGTIGEHLQNLGIESPLTIQQGQPREGEEPFDPVPAKELRDLAEAVKKLIGIEAEYRSRGDDED
ncbi:MAG TPA: anaerobic ribonucleoside-triphosphate reductase activating protein [Methanotrichaceae archaeon]|nr:anaerobic ribonucleoside-triphosphate reductase activating protein [Methanotrichaceae archaeon]